MAAVALESASRPVDGFEVLGSCHAAAWNFDEHTRSLILTHV